MQVKLETPGFACGPVAAQILKKSVSVWTGGEISLEPKRNEQVGVKSLDLHDKMSGEIFLQPKRNEQVDRKSLDLHEELMRGKKR